MACINSWTTLPRWGLVLVYAQKISSQLFALKNSPRIVLRRCENLYFDTPQRVVLKQPWKRPGCPDSGHVQRLSDHNRVWCRFIGYVGIWSQFLGFKKWVLPLNWIYESENQFCEWKLKIDFEIEFRRYINLKNRHPTWLVLKQPWARPDYPYSGRLQRLLDQGRVKCNFIGF